MNVICCSTHRDGRIIRIVKIFNVILKVWKIEAQLEDGWDRGFWTVGRRWVSLYGFTDTQNRESCEPAINHVKKTCNHDYGTTFELARSMMDDEEQIVSHDWTTKWVIKPDRHSTLSIDTKDWDGTIEIECYDGYEASSITLTTNQTINLKNHLINVIKHMETKNV